MRAFVVDVQVRTGDERATGGDVHCAQIVGFDLAVGFVHQAAQRLQVAFRFEQRLRRDDDFLAGVGEFACQRDPVGHAQLLAARADDLADVDDVDGRVLRHLGVEIEHGLFRPEVEQGTQGKFHNGYLWKFRFRSNVPQGDADPLRAKAARAESSARRGKNFGARHMVDM